MGRRRFLQNLGAGLGSIALADMMNPVGASAAALATGHVAPKARRVIYLFQSGGPAQMDLFDYKAVCSMKSTVANCRIQFAADSD